MTHCTHYPPSQGVGLGQCTLEMGHAGEHQWGINYRELLLSLCASLTLCDHMGDVSNDVYEVLKRLQMPQEILDAGWEDLGKEFGKLGVKTVWNTTLGGDD